MRTSLRTLLVAVATAGVAASSARAQGPISTGVFVGGRDVNWDVSVAGASYVDAFQVVNNPGWNDFAGPTAARWISFSSSASNPGGVPYTFQTTFDLTGYDPTTAVLQFQCGMDNSLVGMFLNGVAVSNADCLYHGLSAVQTVSTGFQSGVNPLAFIISGDQVTDGFIYNTVSFTARPLATTAAPEPSTYLLLATGLGAIGLGTRRRRSVR